MYEPLRSLISFCSRSSETTEKPLSVASSNASVYTTSAGALSSSFPLSGAPRVKLSVVAQPVIVKHITDRSNFLLIIAMASTFRVEL